MGGTPQIRNFFLAKILSLKGGCTPLTDNIRKVVFDHLPWFLVKVVFFPTGDTEAGGCQDAASGGGIIITLKGDDLYTSKGTLIALFV